MSIAISLKVHDGVVLAADSASTLLLTTTNGASAGVVTVYNNANKIFNLRKGLPVGCVTCGSGSIGNSSISTIMKDFRREISEGDTAIDPQTYSIEGIARLLAEFLKAEIERRKVEQTRVSPVSLGITVSGYSSKAGLADEWAIALEYSEDRGEDCSVSQIRKTSECGVQWGGQVEVLDRLVVGFSPAVKQTLKSVMEKPEMADELLAVIRNSTTAPLIQPAMPIQDAVDLARFLVETAVRFHRFMPGPQIVGGPVEIAAITRHEGFKWVERKHYWDFEYNREVGDHVQH